MLVKIMFAGSGGQGVLTMGNILGNSAMLNDLNVTYLPSYGAAVRGGTANCTISISDEEIASPVASAPDFVVALNQPSAATFMNRLEPGGQILYNSSMVGSIPCRGDITMFPVPANEIGRGIGNEKSANMVMLGAFIKLTGVVTMKSVFDSIDYMMGEKKRLVEITKKAIESGYNGFPFEGTAI
jgi:2-oxoglutarate ferredoxin oxidoreductase subunit gamma